MSRSLLLLLLLCLAPTGAAPVLAHPGHEDQLKVIEQALAKAPGNQALYLQRGKVYGEIGHFDEAEADFARARELGPAQYADLPESIMLYGKGDLERAMALADRHIAAFPDDPEGFRHRALIARDAGDHERALADLQTHFRLQARPSPGLFVSAANMLVASGRPDDALAVLDQGLEQLGLVPQLQRQALKLELASGRLPAAIARQESLRTVLRDSARWKLDLADLLLQADRQAEARTLLAEASEQLAGQRETPARRALEAKAARLAEALAD
tara:strand:+ start:13591 stop:14403 length:813 start_codon:yes stop_codon:yes gene_type:complete